MSIKWLIPTLILVITTIVAGLITILPHFWVTDSWKHPTQEDLIFLEKLRDVLIKNQLVNSDYAAFHSGKEDMRFNEIFSTYEEFIKTKKKLIDILKQLKPSRNYVRLYQTLNESISSDYKLFTLEKGDYQHALIGRNLKVDYPGLKSYDGKGEKHKDLERYLVYVALLKKTQKWLRSAEEISTQIKIARSNCIVSIKLLNSELHKANFPYIHENVFEQVLETITEESGKSEDKEVQIAFIMAVENGLYELAEELISKGADVNRKNKSGVTALMIAAGKGHTEVVKILLSCGANINEKSKEGLTSLMFATAGGYNAIVKILLAHGAEVNAEIESGESALSGAAEIGHSKVVKTLLENGADVNTKDKSGYTPLMRAAWGGHNEIVEILLANGADVNAKNKNGYTAQMFAAEKRYTKIVEMLKQVRVNGFEVNP